MSNDEPAKAPLRSTEATATKKTWVISFDEDPEEHVSSGSNRRFLMGLLGGGGLTMALLAWMLLPVRPAADVAGKRAESGAGNPVASDGNPNSRPLSTGDTPDIPTDGSATDWSSPAQPIVNVVTQTPEQPASTQPAPLPRLVTQKVPEPITYQPFYPDKWKAKNHSTRMFSWEGEQIVLLTTTSDLDPKTMAVFVKQLDAGWKLCSDLVGQSPRPFREHNGKVTIAAVPDSSYTSGGLSAFLGMSGIEVGGFYAPQGDYDQVHQNPERIPDGFFFGIGQNHFIFTRQCGIIATGIIVALRHVCDEAVNSTAHDIEPGSQIYRFENAFAESNVSFGDAFAPFGATRPLILNDIDGKPFVHSDLNILIASGFLKLRKENGGNDWAKRLFRYLGTCPSTADIKGQLLNWFVSASLAAGKDLSPAFRDRWRFPFSPELWQSLEKVDWPRQGWTVENIYSLLPADQLSPDVAMFLPGFLTPERRKLDLLLGGAFEGDAASRWKLSSWRGNNNSGSVQSGIVKEGRQAGAIHSTVTDDIHFDQTIPVTPGTRYLLSGWVKTKNVVIEPGQQYGKAGANLCIWGGEHSRSITGDSDWTYVAMIFDARDQTEVTVCARLGYWSSIAAGEAWFDDLSLIPIGDSPVSPLSNFRAVPKAEVTAASEAAKTSRRLTNGDFKTQLEGWQLEGGANEFRVFDFDTVPVLTTFGATKDAGTGRLYQCFHVPGDATELQFSLHGGGDMQKTWVALWDGPTLYRRMAARNDTKPFRVRWNVVPLRSKVVTFEIVDKSTSQWGFIGIQQITFNEDKTGSPFAEIRRFQGHQGPVSKVVFSADGTRFLSGSGWPYGDRTMRLWDTETGNSIRLFKDGGMHVVFGVALSPDGQQALSGSGDGIRLWDVGTGTVIRRFEFDSKDKVVHTVSFSPDGTRAVSGGGDGTIRIWNPMTGQQIQTLTGHTGQVMCLAYSPDGSQIVSCGLEGDRTVRLWNSATGNQIQRWDGHASPVESVAFTPDGNRVISAANDALILWDVKTGKIIRQIKDEDCGFMEAVFFPDSRRILSGNKTGRVSVWDSETGAELKRLAEDSEWVWTVAVSADGLRALSGGGSTLLNGKWSKGNDFAIRLWSLEDK